MNYSNFAEVEILINGEYIKNAKIKKLAQYFFKKTKIHETLP